jgi:hypothetical protein
MSKIRIEPLNQEDLPQYIGIGRRFFPDADWAGAPERLGAMLRRWDQGILVNRGPAGEIRAYYTLWPITSKAYSSFLDGALKDEDMSVEQMPGEAAFKSHHWIMTAIAVEPKERDLRKSIILAILDDFRNRTERNLPSCVVAHAATDAGLRFLNRTGFAIPNPDEPKVYALELK